MIKDLESPYIPSERKEKWVKIKPEYVEGMGDDMDLLIIGKIFFCLCSFFFFLFSLFLYLDKRERRKEKRRREEEEKRKREEKRREKKRR
jgi:hypothetical protein